jgi:formamidopyrimidine-DNA glycosylase
MTGRVHVEPEGFDPGPYLKVRLALDDGSSFYFIDVRKFARLWFAREAADVLGPLGPEPCRRTSRRKDSSRPSAGAGAR